MNEKLKNSLNLNSFHIDTSKLKDAVLNFLVPIICFSASVALLLIVIYPTLTSRPQVQENLVKTRTLRQSLETKTSNLNGLVDYKNVLDEDSLLVNKALVSEQAVPGLLSQISYLAKNAGLNVNRLTYAVEQNDPEIQGYDNVNVSLGAEGVYTQMLSFLDSVEKTARFVSVKTIRYSVDPKVTSTLVFNIVLSSPYLYVESTPVTDEPVNLDIRSSDFTSFMTQIKGMTFYDPAKIEEEAAMAALEKQQAEDAKKAAAEAAAQEVVTPVETPTPTQ